MSEVMILSVSIVGAVIVAMGMSVYSQMRMHRSEMSFLRELCGQGLALAERVLLQEEDQYRSVKKWVKYELGQSQARVEDLRQEVEDLKKNKTTV